MPPLRVHHFLAWSLVAALSLTGRMLAAEALDTGAATLQQGIVGILAIAAESAAVVACFVVVSRGVKAIRRDWQPGHGLLVLIALALLYTMLSLALVTHWPGAHATWEEFTRWTYRRLQLAIGAACAFAVRQDWRWLSFFVVLVLTPIIWPLVPELLARLGPLDRVAMQYASFVVRLDILGAALLALALRHDHTASLERHWTHWCGVVVWLVIFVVACFTTAYFHLFGPMGLD